MTITVEIELCKDCFCNFLSLEKEIFRQLMSAGREIFKNILESLDEAVFSEHDRKQYRDKGKRKTNVKSLFGVVEYSRHIYSCEDSDGKRASVYLLDALLEKQTIGKVSMSICQMAIESLTESTFRETARQVRSLTGLSISHQAVWNITQAIGSERREEIDKLAVKANKGEGTGELITKILYEEADGIWLHLQGKDREEVGPSTEMKLAIAYDGTTYSGDPKHPRRKLDNKVACAAIESPKEFIKHKEGIVASVYDTDNVELRVLNGDGGTWIKGLKDPEGIYVLDEYHRNKAITTYVRNEDLRKNLRTLLYENKIDTLFEVIDASINSIEDGEEKDQLLKLRMYFSNNREGLPGYYDRGKDIPETRSTEIHHSRLGCMESNIYSIIGNRMKYGRKLWSVNGANNLATILCCKYTTGLENLFHHTNIRGEKALIEKELPIMMSSKAPKKDGVKPEYYNSAHVGDSANPLLKALAGYNPFEDLQFIY